MAVNGVIGTYERSTFQSTVLAPGHDGVIRNVKVKTGQGVLKAGLLMAYNSDGKLVPYDPSASAPINSPVGVLAEDIDTDRTDVAPIVVHGTVWRTKLLVGSNPPSESDLEKLEEIYIWPVG